MKRQRFKDIAAVFLIVFLLPYVLTMLFSGVPEKKKHGKDTGQTVCIAYGNRTEKITLDKYLIGVLAAQIPVEYEMEALKAQAVLARTYYNVHLKEQEVLEQEGGGQSFLTAAQMKQLWGEQYEQYYSRLEQAVIDTKGKCLYNGKNLVEPYFHAVSAGMTRNGQKLLGEEYTYLLPKECKADLGAAGYVTIKSFSREELFEALQELEGQVSGCAVQSVEEIKEPDTLIQIEKRDEEGYVESVKVNEKQVPGEIFRQCFKLSSAHFQMDAWEDGLRFTCKGLGHGLGMSLYGANQLAKEGKNCQEILQYFFSNTNVKEK